MKGCIYCEKENHVFNNSFPTPVAHWVDEGMDKLSNLGPIGAVLGIVLVWIGIILFIIPNLIYSQAVFMKERREWKREMKKLRRK